MSDTGQLSLTTEYVDLTDVERMARGATLAHLICEATLQAEDHATRKKGMKEERNALELQIAELAAVVRNGKEERPIARERPA